MWNSTLVEDFWWSSGVRVEVRARLLLHPDAEALQSTDDDSAVAVLTAISSLPPSGSGGLGAVPPWLILVAAIVGLALVVLIALVLYKLGFFKRHRHRDATNLMISAKVTRPSRMQGDEYTS